MRLNEIHISYSGDEQHNTVCIIIVLDKSKETTLILSNQAETKKLNKLVIISRSIGV